MNSFTSFVSSSVGPDTCNEEIYTAQSLAETMINFDGLLPEDDLYHSLMNEEQLNLPPTFTLNNASVLPDLLPLEGMLPQSTQLQYAPTHSVFSASLPIDNNNASVQLDQLSENMSLTSRPAKRQRKSKDDERYAKRLEANKKSAQASRERKKHLKGELETRLESLQKESIEMHALITSLETENKVLNNEFLQLQRLIGDATTMSNSFNYSMEKFALKNGLKLKSPAAATMFYLLYMLHSYGQQFNNNSNSKLNDNIFNVISPAAPISVTSL